MDWGVLIVMCVVVWCIAAVALGLLLGRVIRRRDSQTPPFVPRDVRERDSPTDGGVAEEHRAANSHDASEQ
jgi:hypothetical protein